MNCLNGFFALSKQCSITPPTSELYIDMLEGISMKSLSNIVGADKLTAQKLVDEKTTLVGELLKANPNLMLLNDAVEHSIDSLVSKDFKDDFTTGEAINRGIRIEKKRGQLTKLVVERFYFKSHTAVTDLVITITDGVQSETHTVTAEADEEVIVEANFSTNNLWVTITYNSDVVEPYIGTICPYNTFLDADCHGCDGSKSLKLKTIEGNEFLIAYRGIRVDASVQCDREKMICLIAQNQKMAILYLVGAEILKEWYSSDRINYLAINSKEWAKEKAIEWESKGNEILFNNSQGIRRYIESKQRECFICNQVNYGYTLP